VAVIDGIPLSPVGESWREWFNKLFLTISRGWVPSRVVTSSQTVQVTDHIILVNASGGAVTLTLPGADKIQNKILRFVKIDSSVNAMVISGNGQNISGTGTKSTTTQYAAYTITGYGSLYYVI
jgi:hypothetical protein